jgi:hypothetical protein
VQEQRKNSLAPISSITLPMDCNINVVLVDVVMDCCQQGYDSNKVVAAVSLVMIILFLLVERH